MRIPRSLRRKWECIPVRPSWSLIRRLGVGDLSKLCTITYLIAYPYAWTVNFEICIDVQLTTPQPPISKTSQAAAWSQRYIGCWVGKTEGSPIGFIAIVWSLKNWKFPWQKWSIWCLWEHFLVLEHRISIWLGFILGLHPWNIDGTHQNQVKSNGFINILKSDIDGTHQNPWNSLGLIDILKSDIDGTHQNDWNFLGFIDILKYWMNHEFTKPLFSLTDSNIPTSFRNWGLSKTLIIPC